MRILHIGTDDIAGGAARCAYRLHRALLHEGVDSQVLVRRKKSEDPSVREFEPSRSIPKRARRFFRRSRTRRELGEYSRRPQEGYEPFHGDRAEYGPELLGWIPTNTMVVNLHWVAKFLDYRTMLPALLRRTPLVWTLHDMNAFTGGCHYDEGCGRFNRGCGRCPQLRSESESDPSSLIWERKRALFGRLPAHRIHFVTPSRWLGAELRASGVIPSEIPVTVIPYGLETGTFRPVAAKDARASLGLPRESNVILFVAESIKSRRKGFEDLRRALALLDGTENLLLLSVGKGDPVGDMGIEHHHLGFVTDDDALSIAYSAADVFAMPSREDNLPATVLESLACGTPVAAFDTGGLSDMVRPGATGALAPVGDHVGFAKILRGLLEGGEALRAQCRRVAELEYSSDVQARRYTALYESLTLPAARSVPAEA